VAFCLAFLAAVVSCQSPEAVSDGPSQAPVASSTPIRFAVLSDLHLHDVAKLGTPDPELTEGARSAESVEIIEAVVTRLTSTPIEFVLVAGDLTRDGELENHQRLVTVLSRLTAAGKKVLVVPGNHDIDNPEARSHLTNPPTRVRALGLEEWKSFYADFGYRDAIARDPDSLSYVSEPVTGLRVIALDSNDREATPARDRPRVGGRIGKKTRRWLLEAVDEARSAKKDVLVLMHHNLVEHFEGEALGFPEYLVKDYLTVGQLLALRGVRLAFTGHSHANDVTTREYRSSQLTDCETGSLIAYPHPYRLAELSLDSHQVTIQTNYLTSLPSEGRDFVAVSEDVARAGLDTTILRRLTDEPLRLSDEDAKRLLPRLTAAILGHAEGDETDFSLGELGMLELLRRDPDPTTRLFGHLLLGLRRDLPPTDNQVSLSLTVRPH
jgi:3',5'-cyclic AMP phosphodiesterase CpdA